ncbi:DUF4189 domain-containing protein [Luteimonas fraxinea]
MRQCRACVLCIAIGLVATLSAAAQQPGSADYNRVFLPAHGVGDTRQAHPDDRWGAYAVSETNGLTGFVTGHLSEGDAVRAATTMCAERGGGMCALEVTFVNECAAVATSSFKSRWAIEPTLRSATNAAKRDCGRACEIRWSGCSGDATPTVR